CLMSVASNLTVTVFAINFRQTSMKWYQRLNQDKS
ncbi:MAG: hypothetical protein ACI814_000559, partial [Mariniblastus sp.]